jgi:hypothetical protein
MMEDRAMFGVFPTAEVRWFGPGAIPPAIRNWFRSGERQPLAEPVRVDHYLCLPGIDALGVKIRQGRIEIKQRTSQQGIVQFQERIAGLVEHWLKWSLELAVDDAAITAELTSQPDWLAVQKE